MQFRTRCTGDLDEAREVLDGHYSAGHVDVLTPRAGWRARFDLTPPGPVSIGDLGFGVDVRARFGELGAYHIDLPRSGYLIWHQGGGEPRRATPGSAAVFHPYGDIPMYEPVASSSSANSFCDSSFGMRKLTCTFSPTANPS